MLSSARCVISMLEITDITLDCNQPLFPLQLPPLEGHKNILVFLYKVYTCSNLIVFLAFFTLKIIFSHNSQARKMFITSKFISNNNGR